MLAGFCPQHEFNGDDGPVRANATALELGEPLSATNLDTQRTPTGRTRLQDTEQGLQSPLYVELPYSSISIAYVAKPTIRALLPAKKRSTTSDVLVNQSSTSHSAVSRFPSTEIQPSAFKPGQELQHQ